MTKLSALLLLLCLSVFHTHGQKNPNVLLIMTDDQGWGDLGSHGNDVLETKHLDQLAAESVRLNRFYVSPVCAPTRASLLTGKYHLRTGTVSVSAGLERMRGDEYTLAEVFRDNGYHTGCFGKWHNGEHFPEDPNGQGFDSFFGFTAGHWNNYFNTALSRNYTSVPTKGYITDVLTDEAIRFIKSSKEGPFFCYVPYNAPHSPHQVPDVYFNKYKAKGLDDELASVYGMVENVDDNVGRLLNTLDSLGLAENTVVIFLTDNGPNGHRYNGGMKGIKGSVDEGGVRVPFFVRWKNTLVPGTREALSAHIDVLPTLVELCGLNNTNSHGVDGISLAPVLRSGDHPTPDRMIFTHTSGHRILEVSPFPGSVRTDRYRLVLGRESIGLYDMQEDPAQQRNIAATEPGVAADLKLAYGKWFDQATDSITLLRPLPVAGMSVALPATEAAFTGGLRYKQGNGWANDWLTGWTAQTDSVSWHVDVASPGVYRVRVRYAGHPWPGKTAIRISTGPHGVEKKIRAFQATTIPSPDRVVRKEVYERTWATETIGKLTLAGGRQIIVLTAPRLEAPAMLEIMSLELVPAGR